MIHRAFDIPPALSAAAKGIATKRVSLSGSASNNSKIYGLACILSQKMDAKTLSQFPDLKVLGTVSAGVDHIDLKYCEKRGIKIIHTPGVLTEATAELTLALLLACARKSVQADRYLRAGKFRGWGLDMFLGIELQGKSALIFGRGKIGKRASELFRGLGMKTKFITRNTPSSTVQRLLKSCDVLSIHAPLTPHTHHWLDSKKIGLLKRSCIVLNTARGPIIDEAALAQALKRRKILAAGLDVFEFEPKVNSKLMKLDNVVLLPHIGSATLETRSQMLSLCLKGISQALRGGSPENLLKRY